MISFAHAGDGTHVWDGATLFVDTLDASDTWIFDARFDRSDVSAIEVVEDIMAWAQVAVFALDYWLLLDAMPLADAMLALQLRLGILGGWTQFEASAGLAALLGWPSGLTQISGGYVLPESTPTGAYGTVASEVWELENWTRWGRERGSSSGSGGWSRGVASSELRRPAVRGIMSEVQAVALADGQRAASVPRRAHVYDPAALVWREVAVGEVTSDLDGDMLYRVSFEVLG